MTSPEGIPVAIEVFKGNTGDPATVAAQVTRVKDRFGIEKVVLVGDRGMLTAARLREDVAPAHLDWITALRAPQVKKLVRGGDLQLTLFDQAALAEIPSPRAQAIAFAGGHAWMTVTGDGVSEIERLRGAYSMTLGAVLVKRQSFAFGKMRGRGVGSALLRALIAIAEERGMREVVLNAQLQAMEFYRRHGFVAEGEPFLDAGIAHQRMRRSCRVDSHRVGNDAR